MKQCIGDKVLFDLKNAITELEIENYIANTFHVYLVIDGDLKINADRNNDFKYKWFKSQFTYKTVTWIGSERGFWYSYDNYKII